MSSRARRSVSLLAGASFALALAACHGSFAYATSQSAPDAGSPRRLEPVDEAAKDPSFLEFRERLLQAIDRRDAKYVVGIVDPRILNSFGDNNGVAAFRRIWKPERADSKLWTELREVVTRGGAFRDGAFWAPYVYSSFPDDLDSFEYVAVLGDAVVLRSRPDTSGTTVATLAYDLVKVDYTGLADPENAPWYKVATTDGREGYLPAGSFRSPVDYRASFAKKRGVWRMTVLVAGD